MTLRIFVSRDSEGRPWAPDYAHEVEPALEIIKKLWIAYHHLPELYLVMANLQYPAADMVIMTERGVGIVELKSHPGRITISSTGYWYYDGKPIRAGKHESPHCQVQAYGDHIRKKILPFILPEGVIRDEFKFQTAVCFTHPDAKVDEARSFITLNDYIRRKGRPWESNLTIATLHDIPAWVASLRFQVDMGRQKDFEPYRLGPKKMEKVAIFRLGATEWEELQELMPTGRPYGYLVLHDESDQTHTFSLLREKVFIGRDPGRCQVVIPAHFSRVSREHAIITRQVDGVVIEDQSSHGTYLNGKQIRKPHMLLHGDIITLGGDQATRKVCQVEFLLSSEVALNLRSTEVGTDSV